MIEISMAIVVHNDKILIAQRKKGKHQEFMWEFPGGKLEKGETLQECVTREFKEEFDKDIVVGDFFMDKTYSYADKGEMHKEAAKRLGVKLEECVVVEDSISAIKHAKDNGAGCIIAIGNESAKEEIKKIGVNHHIKDFTEMTLEWLK